MTRYHHHSDLKLCEELKSGKASVSYGAFSEIYARYSLTLLNHAYNKCHDRDEAGDLVQDVFAVLWERRAVQQITGSLFGYLASAVRHAFLNQLAHEKVREKYQLYEAFFSAVSCDNADHLIRDKQLMAFIEKEVEALPPRMRRVFKMCRNQGMNYRQVGKALGIAETTVASHMSQAVAILRCRIPYFIIFIWLGKPQ